MKFLFLVQCANIIFKFILMMTIYYIPTYPSLYFFQTTFQTTSRKIQEKFPNIIFILMVIIPLQSNKSNFSNPFIFSYISTDT